MWQQLNTMRVNDDFSSNKRDKRPKQISLSITLSWGRNVSAVRLDEPSFSESTNVESFRILKLSNLVQMAKSANDNLHDSNVKCFNSGPNIFKTDWMYFWDVSMIVIASS